MKSKTNMVVIGGGAVGTSMLYHLAKKGWSDVVLVERKELTSGSTWHAAVLLPLFNMSYSVGQLHKYAVNFYKTPEFNASLSGIKGQYLLFENGAMINIRKYGGYLMNMKIY